MKSAENFELWWKDVGPGHESPASLCHGHFTCSVPSLSTENVGWSGKGHPFVLWGSSIPPSCFFLVIARTIVQVESVVLFWFLRTKQRSGNIKGDFTCIQITTVADDSSWLPLDFHWNSTDSAWNSSDSAWQFQTIFAIQTKSLADTHCRSRHLRCHILFLSIQTYNTRVHVNMYIIQWFTIYVENYFYGIEPKKMLQHNMHV